MKTYVIKITMSTNLLLDEQMIKDAMEDRFSCYADWGEVSNDVSTVHSVEIKKID